MARLRRTAFGCQFTVDGTHAVVVIRDEHESVAIRGFRPLLLYFLMVIDFECQRLFAQAIHVVVKTARDGVASELSRAAIGRYQASCVGVVAFLRAIADGYVGGVFFQGR